MNHTNLQFVYRDVAIERIDEIRPLWEELNAYHLQLSPHFADEVGRRTFEFRKREILAKTQTGKVRIELAAAGPDGADVAYCIATVSADGVAEVDSIFVAARFRGCGIGTELMQRALAWFRAAGATSTVVSVMHGNDEAVAFYRRFGFHPRAVLLRHKS
jgi:diamine N-acetyltransferase